MICYRCNKVVRLDTIANDVVAGYNIESLHCPTCSSCVSLKVDGVKKTLEEVLENEEMADGWHQMTEGNEILAHYALSQIVYRRCEGPEAERNECEFDLPDETDTVRILWKNNRAIGFYSLREKGTYVEWKHQVYDMVTLDTAYINSKYRGQGHGLSIIEDIHLNHPGEDIGFSSPIALPMLRVIEKFIKKHPDMKYKLWEITSTGCEGDKKLVWFTIAKNNRSRSAAFRRQGRSL